MESLRVEEVEDFSEEECGPLAKRARSSASTFDQWSSRNPGFPVPPSKFNPLDEPSPLGLRLKKSPSLLDLIQMKLSQGSASSVVAHGENAHSMGKHDANGIATSCVNDKMKASNFPAILLRIGSWEYVSKYEGDLVAKCYFAKHKLVWEVLEGGLKSKIEIQWSDITSLKADCPDKGPSTLTIALARQPVFFRETNPQPRKHTLWQASNDFTDGQAERNRQHYLQCSPGVLNKHFEKLIQCDMRLNMLSRQPEIILGSPYFDSQASGIENSEISKSDAYNKLPSAAEGSPSSVLGDVESGASALSSTFNFRQNPLAPQHISYKAPSPSSVMDTQAIEGNIKVDEQDSLGSKILEPLRVPGLSSSMSMSDLVNHIENCISEKMISKCLPSDKASECQDILENIAQVLLSDTQHAMGLDEKSLMKKVNSLCCLLQDPVIASSAQIEDSQYGGLEHGKNGCFDNLHDSIHEGIESKLASQGNIKDRLDCKQASSISRKDSLGDFLLHLPRISSLPKFLFGIAEDDEFQAM